MGWTTAFSSWQREIFLSYNPTLPSGLALNPTDNSVRTRRHFFTFRNEGFGGGEIKHDDVQSTPSSGFSSIIAVHLDGMLLRYREKFTMCEFWGLSRAAAENSDAASWRILLGHFDLRRWGHYVVSKRRHPITHWRCFISQNHHCAPCLVNLLRVS